MFERALPVRERSLRHVQGMFARDVRLSGWRKNKSANGWFMIKTAFATVIFFMVLVGCASARNTVLVEPASSGHPYDYVVHVQNTFSIGYNPLVREDRERMALRALRRQCRAARVVGDNKIITEIWGITSSLPDYIVLVKCT